MVVWAVVIKVWSTMSLHQPILVMKSLSITVLFHDEVAAVPSCSVGG
jgi:hypothetical protein